MMVKTMMMLLMMIIDDTSDLLRQGKKYDSYEKKQADNYAKNKQTNKKDWLNCLEAKAMGLATSWLLAGHLPTTILRGKKKLFFSKDEKDVQGRNDILSLWCPLFSEETKMDESL